MRYDIYASLRGLDDIRMRADLFAISDAVEDEWKKDMMNCGHLDATPAHFIKNEKYGFGSPVTYHSIYLFANIPDNEEMAPDMPGIDMRFASLYGPQLLFNNLRAISGSILIVEAPNAGSSEYLREGSVPSFAFLVQEGEEHSFDGEMLQVGNYSFNARERVAPIMVDPETLGDLVLNEAGHFTGIKGMFRHDTDLGYYVKVDYFGRNG